MPVKLFDSPGYRVFADAETITEVYDDFKAEGFDFTATSTADKINKQNTIGGASVHRPLTYQELDTNFKDIYPVGSVYMNATDARNPLEILGFGIWERLPAGNTLFNIASSTLDSTKLQNKILSASVKNNVVTLKIKPLLTDEVRSNLRAFDFNANNFRFESLIQGQKINVRGITLPADATGTPPNGIFTITEISSETWDATDLEATVSTIEESTFDENTIKFQYVTEYEGNYSVLGPSDGQEDNAYYTSFDDTILDIGKTHIFKNSNSDGGFNGFDVDLTIQNFPPHYHGRLNGNVKTKKRFTGSTAKHHKYDSGGAYDDADYDWYIPQFGGQKIPSSTSNAATRYGGTTISSAGTNTTIPHENRQPFVAVHMWKRTA